jgi:hypothetical protein
LQMQIGGSHAYHRHESVHDPTERKIRKVGQWRICHEPFTTVASEDWFPRFSEEVNKRRELIMHLESRALELKSRNSWQLAKTWFQRFKDDQNQNYREENKNFCEMNPDLCFCSRNMTVF